MSNWTIGKRLIVGFAFVMAVTAGLGGFAYWELMTIGSEADDIASDSLPGVYTAGRIGMGARDAMLLVPQHIQADDKSQMERIESEMTRVGSELTTLITEYEKSVSAEERPLIEAIKAARAEFLRIRENDVLPLSRALKAADAYEAFEKKLQPAFDRFMIAVEADVDFNKKRADAGTEEIKSAIASANTGIILGILVAIAAGAGVAFTIIRSTNAVLRTSVSELREGAEQVVSAAGQVSTSAQSLSQGATEQAASLEETSASMEEMASMTRKNAESSQDAAALMNEVDASVVQSNQALQAMVGSMNSIKESSAKVSKIIKTIDEIAFQTNILALNAAVEAARAGEAGMGFAVVADEVRNLAQRSAQAAKDTAGLIEESIANSAEGSAKVDEVAGSISAITESVAKVKGLVQEVSVASRQQSQGIDQVSQAIAQMEKVTQTTAATAEESAAASEELNAQAETSMSVVARLDALVGGTVGSPAVKTAKPRAATPAKVVGLASRAKRPETMVTRKSAEEEIPLGGTGTYGSF